MVIWRHIFPCKPSWWKCSLENTLKHNLLLYDWSLTGYNRILSKSMVSQGAKCNFVPILRVKKNFGCIQFVKAHAYVICNWNVDHLWAVKCSVSFKNECEHGNSNMALPFLFHTHSQDVLQDYDPIPSSVPFTLNLHTVHYYLLYRGINIYTVVQRLLWYNLTPESKHDMQNKELLSLHGVPFR